MLVTSTSWFNKYEERPLQSACFAGRFAGDANKIWSKKQ